LLAADCGKAEISYRIEKSKKGKKTRTKSATCNRVPKTLIVTRNLSDSKLLSTNSPPT
jgi:serine kinase of HPr protein (carbohydrate metabolism regulator)